VSIVSSITIPSNVGIIGRSVESFNNASNLGSPTLGSVIKGTGVTGPTITMNSFSQLYNIQVNGNNTVDAINVAAGYATIQDASIFGGLNGINGGAANLGLNNNISNCTIHENAACGITQVIQSRIENCNINNNVTAGIFNGNNNNQNIIVGNRFSFNGTYAIQMFATSGCYGHTICGNVIDASGNNNIQLTGVHTSTVSGNVLARAGRSQLGTPGSANDASIYLANCVGVIVSANTSWVGNNGSSGYVGPFYGVFDGSGNTNCAISSNIFAYNNNSTASTVGPINVTTTFNLASSLNVSYWANAA
jgi:hypothetical protein